MLTVTELWIVIGIVLLGLMYIGWMRLFLVVLGVWLVVFAIMANTGDVEFEECIARTCTDLYR